MDQTTVTELLRGAVDLHYHSGPSPFPRKMDVAQAAKHYNDAGFRAVAMKSHHHSTVMEILALESTALKDLEISVYGGIALNGAVGGLNPRGVDLALHMGGGSCGSRPCPRAPTSATTRSTRTPRSLLRRSRSWRRRRSTSWTRTANCGRRYMRSSI